MSMRYPTRAPAALIAAGAVMFGGCATQEAVTQQTGPLQAQVVQLETSLRANQAQADAARSDLADARSREQALAAQGERLAAEIAAVRQQLAGLAREQEALRADMQSASAIDGRQARSAETAIATLAAQLNDLSARLAMLADAAQAEQSTQAAGRAQADARMAAIETRLDDLARLARSAMEKAAQEDIRRNGKVAFSVLLTEDRTLYPLNLQQLGAKDRAVLDDLVKRVREMEKDYHLEIQGHTDNTSADDFNYQLGKARAEVVKRYLHEVGGIPLGWMSVISYGATMPIDPKSNNNRRIVIQALVLDPGK